MLKSLTTLIKISKAHLDEKRKQLAILLDRKQRMIDEIKILEESIKFEADNLHKNSDAALRTLYLDFVFGVRMKQGRIFEEMDKLTPAINKITDEIAQIYSEMKKYEIVKDNRIAEMNAELERKRQVEIDEMAIMNYVRKSEAENNS